MPANIGVPTDIREITTNWLLSALGDVFPIQVNGTIQVKQIGQDFGFASQLARVSWQSASQPNSVVVKLWESSAAGMGEVNFYRHIKDCATRIPHCFYSAISEDGQRGVLILEDLKNVIQGDVLKRLKGEQANNVAKNLANLHGPWMRDSRLDSFEWISEKSISNRSKTWFIERRETFLSRFPTHLNGLPLDLLNNIDHTPKIVEQRLKGAPITFLHGDFHLDNILFANQIEPVFLDWARPTKGPLALNLADLLFTMIPLEEFDKVLNSYIDAFNQIAKQPLDKKELLHQLGGALLQKFAINTCGIALFNPTLPRAVQLIDDGIYHAAKVIDFWHKRDSELFSFL